MLNSKDTAMPEPTYMSKAQTVQYLSDLRTPNLKRPSGSRPPPSSKYDRSRAVRSGPAVTDDLGDKRPVLSGSNSMPAMPTQSLSHRKTEPSLAATTQIRNSPFVGRPLARAPQAGSKTNDVASHVRRTPSMTYMESGSRWMEKQEAKSLRLALEDMDLEQERRIHSAAQDEAAELVWKHQNPHAPFANPESVKPNPDAVRDYRSHLRKGSYQRSISHGSTSTESQRSASGSSGHSVSSDNAAMSLPNATPRKANSPNEVPSSAKGRSAARKSYDGLAKAVASDIANAHRRVSSGSNRVMSGEKQPFMNPNDSIWEDPQEETTPAKKQILAEDPAPPAAQIPAYFRKNPFARVRAQYDRVERSNSAPLLPTAPMLKHDRVEIQRNAPSQSRNPWYMSNQPLPPQTSGSNSDEADAVSPKATPTKDGREIRTDDIRAATSKSRKDYSPNLPRPTMVSDKPGRPIVSFQQDWRPREIMFEEATSSSTSNAPRLPMPPTSATFAPAPSGPNPSVPQVPQICVESDTRPPVPQLCFPDEPNATVILPPDAPDFSLSDSRSAPSTPAIHVETPSFSITGSDASTRIDQGTSSTAARPSPRHAASAPVARLKSSLHYTPSIRQSGALCAHCALPIAGRILSAAGQRFHPGCFICHQCHTNLECVAFYPEPDRQRNARIERIRARRLGLEVGLPETAVAMEGQSAIDAEAEDGVDGAPRFYCHLDFHERFSPRCKSCKTPIEGEVVVACGAEWHAGHFFCAQCGDPFDSTTPFVEKDGYAWCVGCHTNRYSGKCGKCRKPVTDVVVKALGKEWHQECFVCMECHGEFKDGRYFLRGDSQDPVCVRCEERRLKA